MGKATARVWLAGLLVTMATAAQAAPRCVGDCDGDAHVSVDELVLGVGLSVGGVRGECAAIDMSQDGIVSIDELVGAVNNALVGCPDFVQHYASTVALEHGTATLDASVDSTGAIGGTLLIDDGGAALSFGGSGAATTNVPITGHVDLDSGEFSIDGSYSAGGVKIPVHISGTLPGHAGVSRPFMMQIGSFIYNGAIGFASAPTPTATPTPVSGTRHDITVGGSPMVFDPEFLNIDVGDTVVWTWVGGPHSVVSSPNDVFNCNPSGLFDSGEKTSGTFAYTFTEPGEYGFHCGVGNHCGQEFESGLINVNGPPSPTPTATSTRTPTPTETPTPELIGGLSRNMIGTFAGKVTFEISGFQQDFRMKIEVIGDSVFVTDLSGGFIFGVSPLQFLVASPRKIFYHQDFGGLSTRDITFDLSNAGVLTGSDQTVTPGMPSGRVSFNLTKEG